MTTQTTDHTLLVAEYTLGLLSPTETAQAQRLLGTDPQALADAMKWEQALLELTDRLTPAPLSDTLWEEIAHALGMDAAAISAYPLPLRPEQSASTRIPATSSPTLTPAPTPQTQPFKAASTPVATPAVSGTSEVPGVSGMSGASGVAAPSTQPAQTAAQVQPNVTSQSAQATAPNPGVAPANTSGSTSASTPVNAYTNTPTSTPVGTPDSATPLTHQAQTISKPASAKRSRPKKPSHKASNTGWHVRPWHIGAGVALIAIGMLASRLIPATPAAPPITVLEVAPTQAAILQAPGHSSTPAWVVTVTPHGDVLLHPQVPTQTLEQTSVQLWTYSLGRSEPRSLGLIDPNLPVTVPASLMGEIAPDQIFEMTQEPSGGSPDIGPSGPVLFIGRIVTFGQPVPTPVPASGADTASKL